MAEDQTDRDPGATTAARALFPMVRRGYNPTEVDAYVQSSQAELARLAAETRALNATIARLRAEADAPVRPAATADALATWKVAADELHAGARADIDRIVAAARADADELLRSARDEVALLHIELSGRHENERVAAAEAQRAAAEASASALEALRRVDVFIDAAVPTAESGGDTAPDASSS